MASSHGYALVTDINTRLRLDAFSANTLPTLTTVEDIMSKVEDFIIKYTGHAWDTTTVTDEYYDYDGSRLVFMNHRKITTFVSGTDKLEVRDLVSTGTWTDLALTANGYTEASSLGDTSDDYYIDYAEGKIYFLNTAPLGGSKRIRLTYRYGESSVDNDIEEACILLSMAKVAPLVFQPHPTAGDENFLALDSRIREWKKEAMDLLYRHKEPKDIANNQFTSKRRFWLF
jgi:hypothetical protein